MAERKVVGLLEAGAQVVVVAPKITGTIEGLAQAGRLQVVREMFHVEHLAGAFLVIAATSEKEVNALVAAKAEAASILVNVVDSPALCSFYLPASVRRGKMTISVSTAGESPALAAHIQDELEAAYGEEYGRFAQILGELRGEVRARIPGEGARREAWQRVVKHSGEVLLLLRNGATEEAREVVRNWLFSPLA